MLACLATVQPLDTATGTRTTIYVSSVNDRVNGALVNGLNGQVWEPALVQAPVLGISLWNGDFQAAVSPAAAAIPLKMQVVKASYPTADALNWIGAPVSIYAETPGTAWPWTARFVGRVKSFARKGQTLTLTAEVNLELFSNNILTAVYAGTGGAEGGADLKNQVKPLALGWAKNVEPVLIDTTNNVFQFSAYGAIEAVTTLFERGSDFGASQGDYATYAALVAATIPAGKWGTCLAAGMIRLGAPAYGVITADIKGHKVGATTPRLTGAIVNALATIAGVSSGDIDTATLTALDAAVPYSANMVLTSQTTFFDQARAMAIACNYQAGVSLPGKFFVAKVSLTGSIALELNAKGQRSPQIVQSDEADVSVPYWRTVLGANRAWRVHTADEIAFQAQLVELGIYASGTVYRDGNIVSLADGSRWVYVNVAPGSGNAPPTWPTTSNSYWSNLAGPTSASWSLVANDNGAKPADNAGSNFSLVTGGETTKIAAVGNTITQTVSTATAWNAWAYTEQSLVGTAIVSGKHSLGTSGDGPCLGLVTPANKNVTGYQSMAYAIHRNLTTFYALEYVSGVSYVETLSGTPANGDVLSVVWDNVNVKYYQGTTLLYTSTRPPAAGSTFHAKCMFNSIGSVSSISNLLFTPYTDNNFASTGGATVPEANATIDANIAGNNPVIIFAESTGAPKTGEISRVLSYKLFRLGSALTSGVTWAATLISGNATFTISGAGTATLTVTGPNNSTLAVESVIRLTSSYLSVSRTLDVKVIRQDDPPTNTGGGGTNPGTTATTTSLGNTTGTAFPGVASAMLKVKAGTAGQVACTFPGGYKRTPGTAIGGTTATGKWQWRVVSGTFADIDAGVTGIAADTVNEPPIVNSAGSGAFDATKTGLTSGTEYEFQFIWHRNNDGGTANEVYRSSGTIQAAGS